MIIVNGITDELRIRLSGAATTNQFTCIVCWDDGIEREEGRQLSLSNDTNWVTIVQGIENFIRNVGYINIFNKDTVSGEVEICYYDGSSYYCLRKITLSPGESLEYTEGSGFQILRKNEETELVEAIELSNLTYYLYLTNN
jgi:hypothetical protein